MTTQNPARSRPLSRNVVRLMKESRASPQNPKVIKAARKMGPKEIAYCEKQGDIFMTAVDLDVPISRFAGLYMNSQVAGLLDVSFSQANGIESDEIADLIQLPMLLESPELIVALVIWLNDVVQATEEDDSTAILRALSSPATAPLAPYLSSATLNEVQMLGEGEQSDAPGNHNLQNDDGQNDNDQPPEDLSTLVKRYEYAYWLGYIYRYECLLHEEASRMVFSVLDEPLMREMYGHLKLGNINLADCAPEICQRLDMMIVNKL